MTLVKPFRIVLAASLLALFSSAQTTKSPIPLHKKHLLVIGASQGFQHDSISDAMATFWKLGKDSGIWDTTIRTDTQLITKKKLDNNAKNLDYFDAIYFYTTRELPMDDEQKAALISFVKDDGKGFIGGHSATDTFYTWPEYGEMVGGHFDDHPWHQEARIVVEDLQFPGTWQFGPKFMIDDEFYQMKNFSREKVHVLMSIDTTSVDIKSPRVHRTDGDFALVWMKQYGKGRVFMNALGHEPSVYQRTDMQRLFTESVRWAMGLMEYKDLSSHPRPKN